MTESTALTVQQRAKTALGVSQTEEQLKALAVATVDIKKVTNADGREQVHTAMMTLKNTRCEIERLGKQAREDATKFSKAVIVEEDRLIALIQPEETRLAALRKEWDDAVEAEKQRKIDAELKRTTDIKDRIEELKGNQSLTSLCDPTLLADHVADLEKIPVDATFEEFEKEAAAAKVAGLSRLKDMQAAAEARVAAEAKLAADLAELEKLRAEQAEAARKAKIAADEEAAKVAASQKIEADRLAAVKAENDKIEADRAAKAKAEADKIAAEQKAAADKIEADRQALAIEQAEAKRKQDEAEARIAADRQKLADEQEAARIAALPKPVIALNTGSVEAVAAMLAPEDLAATFPFDVKPVDEDKERAAFEARVSSPPFECCINRFPDDETKTAWPGQYRSEAVQLAWDFVRWRASRG